MTGSTNGSWSGVRACRKSSSQPCGAVLLGLAGNGVTAGLPVDDVVNNDLAITASFGYTSTAWAQVAGLLRAGKIHLAPLITRRFPLEAFADAYRTLREGTGPRGKVLLEVNPR